VSRFVLDTYALLAYFQDETGADRVFELLRRASQEEIEVYLSRINLGEFLYIVERRQGSEKARHALALLETSPLRIAEATRERVLAAAHLKARYPISYADAFAVALTRERNATLLTGDPEFRAVEAIIAIEWLA